MQHVGAGMAAIGSFSSLLFINFLVLIGRFALHDVDGYSPNDGLNRLAVFTSSQEFFEAAIALKIFSNNYNNGGKFKINLAKSGFKKTSYSVSKWSKHGLTSLVVAGNDPPVDINIFVDVSRNPGPVSSVSNLLLQDAASASNLHVCSTITIYTRSELFNLCRVSDTSLPAPILFELKNSGILRYRGCRAGRRKIPTIISSDDIRIASTSLASLRTGVVRSNLISIPLGLLRNLFTVVSSAILPSSMPGLLETRLLCSMILLLSMTWTFLQSQKPGYVIVTSMISFVLISVLLVIISFTIPELLLMAAA